MHDPSVFRGPPASRRDPKQGTLIGQSGQARRLPDRQQAYGPPAPTTMRARYSEGWNIRRCHYTFTAPMSRTRGWPGSSAPLTDGRDWPDEVKPPAGRRQPRHLEGQRAAAPAGRTRDGDQRREDVGLVVRPAEHGPARRAGRHLRRARLRCRRTAAARARDGAAARAGRWRAGHPQRGTCRHAPAARGRSLPPR